MHIVDARDGRLWSKVQRDLVAVTRNIESPRRRNVSRNDTWERKLLRRTHKPRDETSGSAVRQEISNQDSVTGTMIMEDSSKTDTKPTIMARSPQILRRSSVDIGTKTVAAPSVATMDTLVTATAPPSITQAPPSNIDYSPTQSASSQTGSHRGISTGVQQAVIAAGSVVAFLIILLIIWLVVRARRKKMRRSHQLLDSKSHTPDRAVRYNFSPPQPKQREWPSIRQYDSQGEGHQILDGFVLHSPEPTTNGQASPSLNSPFINSPGFNSIYVNSPSAHSTQVASPGFTTPPSQQERYFQPPPVAALGRSITSPAKHDRNLYPAPLQTSRFPSPPSESSHTYPRRPNACYTITEYPRDQDAGLSVIGEEIEEYFEKSTPQSRQSPKASRPPSTYSLGRRSMRDRASVAVSIAASVESVPRFRSVSSWVNHQTSRMEGKNNSPQRTPSSGGSSINNNNNNNNNNSRSSGSEEIPDVPNVPTGLGGGTEMRRMDSTSTATVFRHHPGEKIEIGRGSIIPSDVLDQVVNYNLV